ncbi:peptide chain release factor N(5)-glutamine methyltransferase [Edaphobacter flagellatus]|uniref:peptide chain release factor N(5)-glutamine methyltransferase n=1 Tax=Edaphobacter flagellatus TaxID=1933044 RepID=UPI0021B2BD9A|nr:peptide chain release factor N(5)-glutamine methyltransferase [Edaphobacter flagellatus]
MTVAEAIQSAAQRLAADPHLSDTARRDAELLLLHVANISKAALIADPARELAAEQVSAYETAITRRLRHEPIQYITGTQEFFGLTFTVTPAVLIPRPETEHLIETVLERLPHDRPTHIVDVGTGSGAIAIALAVHLPQANITAVDLSPAALDVARSNTRTHGLDARIRFVLSDLLNALSSEPTYGHLDAIVSNPPYVPSFDAPQLHPQVREHEPTQALFAGPDGLDIYRRLIPQAHAALKSGGLLAMEIGHGQRDALTILLSPWKNVCFLDDLQGIPRVVLAIR